MKSNRTDSISASSLRRTWWNRVNDYLAMIRFSHTLFALPFALLSLCMAWSLEWNSLTASTLTLQLVGIVWCMVAARSAAMGFNRLVDRKIDALNPRTERRHLPAGKLRTREVAFFTLASSVAFVAGTFCFWPNRLPLYLAVPVLLFLLGYSYSKRFTALAHFWLGAALMLAPVCAWIAVRGEVVLATPLDLVPAIVLGSAIFLWVSGFDIIYACQDVEFDRAQGLFSVPARVGVPPALRLSAVCHLGTLAALLLLPWWFSALGPLYLVGWGVVAILLVYEHWIVSPDDLGRVNIAFFQVNAVISLGLSSVAALDLLV